MFKINKKMWQCAILAIGCCGCAVGQDVAALESSQILIFPNEKEIADDSDSGEVLVPSFIVNDILSRMDKYDNFPIFAKTYMNGYSKELAQLITQNNFGSYATHRVEWFRFGAMDATKYIKNIVQSGGKADYNLLSRFGYHKIRIAGTYTILHQLEYGQNAITIQTYSPKKLEGELESAILAKKSNVRVEFVGWLSPLGFYDSESGRLTRMLVVESGSLQK